MQAAVFEQFGEPAEVLSIADRPVPTPGPGEVLVRMLACPVNPSDLMTIRGTYGIRPELPAVPGYEGVGVVEQANAGLYGRFLSGKRVAVLNPTGGNWQQQTVVPAKSVIPVSDKLPVEQAAMFFVNPATAYLMTRKVLAVPRGEWLLQSAAGSAVGRMVIRLGKQLGFRTLNIVRREAEMAELRSLGADEVLVFDSARNEETLLIERVRAAAGGRGVRFAIDPVGGETASAMVRCLAQGGRLLAYGSLTDAPMSVSSRWLIGQGVRIEGFWLGRYMETQSLPAKLGLVSQLSKWIQAGVLSSDIAAVFPLDQIRNAVLAAERPAKGGKVLLSLNPV